jgi:hypothetical protein
LYRRLGGSQGRSGWAENLVPTGIRFRTVQPVARSYTDWAIPAPIIIMIIIIIIKVNVKQSCYMSGGAQSVPGS